MVHIYAHVNCDLGCLFWNGFALNQVLEKLNVWKRCNIPHHFAFYDVVNSFFPCQSRHRPSIPDPEPVAFASAVGGATRSRHSSPLAEESKQGLGGGGELVGYCIGSVHKNVGLVRTKQFQSDANFSSTLLYMPYPVVESIVARGGVPEG